MANFFGTNGDDSLDGTAGADTFFTRQGGDNVVAGDGDDVIIVESGAGTGLNADDLINGEEGTDTVELEGSIDDYAISFNISNQLVLTGKPGTLYDGEAEVLVDIELIVFSDQVMRVVDAASTAGSYFTIQSAVDASLAGDQVVIMAGTYAESVTIDKALSLVGQGVNDVTIGSTAVGINVTGDINNGGSETVSISGINFTNHSVGVRADSSAILSSLVIDNASFTGNTTHAVGTSAADGLESITITNSTFEDNGQGGSNGAADIQLFDYHGDVTIENVSITSTRVEGDATATKADYAIQIAGFEQATYDVDEAMGNVSLENVTITGAFHKNALSIQGFTDLTGFSATNVSITGTSEWGYLIFIDPIGSSGQAAPGTTTPNYPGHFNTTADDASIDLSGITVTNNSSNDVGFDVFVRGSSADDVQIGTNARDALNQMAELNTDYGGNDSLEGRGGDDILFGGLGNDDLDGGDDLDVAIFSGNRDDYTIVETGLGTYTVTDNNTVDGDEGTDTLTGIELVQFSDQTLELDANSPDTSGYTERFSQSFDDDSDGFFAPTGYGNIALVASGTDGITSSDGTGHAVFTQSGNPGDESGPYSRMDAYRSEWLGGFTTSLDIYLDDTMIADGEGFDVSFAANGTDGSHVQDFIFHIAHDTSTGDLLIGASNNTNFAPREDLDTLDNHAEASSAGWYTFSWNFYENPLGDLEVAMNVHDESGNWVFTEIRSDLSNDIGTVVGGNRYMWFTNIDVANGVAVDNVSFSTFDSHPVQLIDGTTNSIVSSHANIADAVAVAASGDTVMISAGDYSGESPVNVSVEDLTFRADAGATGISVQLTGTVSDVSLEGEGDVNVTGNAEDNMIAGNEGDNVIDGADGVDTAVYAGNVGDYTITSTTNAAGLVTGFTATTDNNAADGDDGTDTLVSVEALEFADVSLDLSLGVQLFNSAGSLIGTYATIQEAVDAAAGGADETIRVAAGSYAETVHVTKEVTIEGANAGIAHDGARGAETILNGAFRISADNVTVDGFAVNEGETILGQLTAFYVQALDVTITNSTFTRSGPATFDQSRGIIAEAGNTGNGLTVSDSSFSGFHTGVYVNSGEDVTVSGNLFDGNMVGISNDDPDDFLVSGNTFQNQQFENIGLSVVDAVEDLSTQILADNTITGTVPEVSIYPGAATSQDITGTDYADSFNGGNGNETFTGGAGDDEFDGGDGIDTAVFSGNYADYTLDFSTGTIDGPDGSDSFEDIEVFQFDDQSVHVVGTGGYATIQDAVDAASAGDTIIVMSGFYTETVEVDKTLTIVGEEGSSGHAMPVLGLPPGGDPVLNGAFHITADNVTIDGFEVTGGASILGELTTVYVQGLNATITGSTLTRSGLTATFDGSRGIVTETGNTGDGLTVHDSTIIGFHTGLYVNSGTGITVSSSFFRENMVGISNDDPDDFLVTSNFFQNQLFEGIGLGVVDATENLLLQIRADNSFTGTAPEVSIYPLAAGSQDIIGTSHDDVFHGTAEDQIFDGQGGDDSITGGAGNDELKGGTGDDTMIGGEGDDVYDVDSAGDVVTEAAGEGTDAVHGWIDGYTLGSNIENGFVEVSGYKMTGNELDNTLTAVASGGILFGKGGDDTLMGSAGEDTLYAGSGNDLLMGGEGNDQYDVRKVSDAINDTGTDTNDAVKSSVIDLDLNAYTGVEKAVAKGGLDLALTGDAADNALTGNSGANVIEGGGGRDILRGGGGDDVFVFTSVSDSAAGSADRIRDFEQGVVGDPGDIIDLYGIDAVEGGRNNAFTFIGNDAFSSTAGELRYENVTASFGDATYVLADVNGDGNADFRILLDGFFTLEDADFIL